MEGLQVRMRTKARFPTFHLSCAKSLDLIECQAAPSAQPDPPHIVAKLLINTGAYKILGAVNP